MSRVKYNNTQIHFTTVVNWLKILINHTQDIESEVPGEILQTKVRSTLKSLF